MKKNPSSGKARIQAFPEEVVEIYRALVEEGNSNDREELLESLAQTFAGEVSRTDVTLPESLHTLLERLDAARLAFDQAALRLGRALLPGLAQFVSQMDDKALELPRKLDKTAN
jgi:hypothetical protein